MESHDTAASSSPEERQIQPSVSKEKWLAHAKRKLARGYTLVIGNGRRRANFYLPGKGYETCPYDSAKRIVKEGIVEPVGENELGIVYRLKESVAATMALPPRPAAPEHVEEPTVPSESDFPGEEDRPLDEE